MFKRFLLVLAVLLSGCHSHSWTPLRREIFQRPSITAKPASPGNMCEPAGIPFYLPKPLLVISKNFHHIETPTVGLTDSAPIPDSFDSQAEYAALDFTADYQYQSNAGDPSTKDPGDSAEGATTSKPTLHSGGAPTSPAGDIPSDGLAPHTFFTYEIVFVPDMTQKYVLDIQGGAGEMRAAMNLVNGWQYTGLGPFYLKDSSTAQNAMARGLALNLGLNGASDLVSSIAQLQPGGDGTKSVDMESLRDVARAQAQLEANQVEKFDFSCLGQGGILERYAEIHVYEAYIDEAGQMSWRPIVGERDELTGLLRGFQFQREYLGTVHKEQTGVPQPPQSAGASRSAPSEFDQTRSQTPRYDFSDELTPSVTSSLVADVFQQTLHQPEQPKKGHKLLDLFHRNKVSTTQAVLTTP